MPWLLPLKNNSAEVVLKPADPPSVRLDPLVEVNNLSAKVDPNQTIIELFALILVTLVILIVLPLMSAAIDEKPVELLAREIIGLPFSVMTAVPLYICGWLLAVLCVALLLLPL